jgi:hypothetical protein
MAATTCRKVSTLVERLLQPARRFHPELKDRCNLQEGFISGGKAAANCREVASILARVLQPVGRLLP